MSGSIVRGKCFSPVLRFLVRFWMFADRAEI